MTALEYINAGFEISNQLKQSIIDRAEADVKINYIDKIIGTQEIDHNNELMALSFCLMLRRNVMKTRFGAERKSNDYATVLSFEAEELNRFIGSTCANAIKSLETKAGVERSKEIIDIIDCGYYII